MSKKQKHVPPEFVHGAQSRRASNAAGTHRNPADRRQGHRSTARANAVRRNQREQ